MARSSSKRGVAVAVSLAVAALALVVATTANAPPTRVPNVGKYISSLGADDAYLYWSAGKVSSAATSMR